MVRPVAEPGFFQGDLSLGGLGHGVFGVVNRRREIGDGEHAARGGKVMRKPRHGVCHRWHGLEGAECHQWQYGQHVPRETVLAGCRDRDRQQADDGNARERHGKGGSGARCPRTAAC